MPTSVNFWQRILINSVLLRVFYKKDFLVHVTCIDAYFMFMSADDFAPLRKCSCAFVHNGSCNHQILPVYHNSSTLFSNVLHTDLLKDDITNSRATEPYTANPHHQ